MKMKRPRAFGMSGGAVLWVLLGCVMVGIAYLMFRKTKPPERPIVIAVATPIPATPTPPPATPEPVVVKATPTPTPVVMAPPTPAPATPPPLDLATVARSPALWPPQVLLVQAMPFPLLLNGRVVGEAKAPVGTPLRVLRVIGQQVEVEYQAARHVLPVVVTDLMVRSLAIYRQNGSQIPQVAAAATPVVTTVAMASTPAPAGDANASRIGDRLIGDVLRIKHTRTEGGDYDDKRERVELKVKITNTDTRVSAEKLKTEIYIFGESILDRSAVKLLQSQTFAMSLPPRASHEETTEEVVTMYDTTYARFGHKYEGWVLRVRDDGGKVVMEKASAPSLLKGVQKAARLTKDKTYDRSTFKEKPEVGMR